MPRQFFIVTDSESSLVANIQYGNSAPGQAAILFTINEGSANPDWSSLWDLTPEGLIVNAADPNLALAADLNWTSETGYVVITAKRDPTQPTQRWTFVPANPLPNQPFQAFNQNWPGNSYCLAVNKLDENTWLCAVPVDSFPYAEWRLQPAMLDEALITLETALSVRFGLTDDSNEFDIGVLAVDGSSASDNASLTIQLQQPGSLTQTWLVAWDRTIRSLENTDYGITITGMSDDDYVVALTTDPDQWTVDKDGRLHTDYDGTDVYLGIEIVPPGFGDSASVIGSTTPGSIKKKVTGPSVIGSTHSGSEGNQIWLPRRAQPDMQGLFFTIGLASPASPPAILTPMAGGQIYVAQPLDGGVPVLSQLWRMTIGGRVINALSPQLVLTVDATGDAPVLSVEKLDASASGLYQRWVWYGGHQVDDPKDNSRKITVAALVNLGPPNYVLALGPQLGLDAGSGIASVVVQEVGAAFDPSASQLWVVAPHLPAFNQSANIRSGLSGGGTEWLLSIPSENLASGTAATLADNATGPGAGWQFTADRQIVSLLNPAMALSVGIDGQGVCVYPIQPGNPLFQAWMLTPGGLVISRLNGQALTASTDGGGSVSLSSPALSGGKVPAAQQWHCAVGFELQTLLAQPRLPWPVAGKGSEGAAIYEYINGQLGLPTEADGAGIDAGLRLQYLNLAAPLQSYQLGLNLLPCPADPPNWSGPFDQASWTAVVTQLNTEITAVLAVQALFQQIQTLHLALMDAQIPTLSGLANAVQLTQDTSLVMNDKRSKHWIWTLVTGIVYFGGNLLGTAMGDPEEGAQGAKALKFVGNKLLPAVMNAFEAGSSTAQDAMQAGNPGPAVNAAIQLIHQNKLEVLDLQEALIESFQEIGVALGAIETVILSDWAKVRAVYEMTKRYGQPDSLFWPATTTASLLKAMLPGYELNVLQTLIASGSNFTIDRYCGQPRPSGVEPGLQSGGLQYIDFEADGSMSTYELSYGGDSEDDVTDLMDYLWGLGGVPYQFFHRQGGWAGLAFSQQDDGATPDRPYMLFAFRNGLPSEVSISVVGAGPAGPDNPFTVAAFGGTIFCVSAGGGISADEFEVQLWVGSSQVTQIAINISSGHVWSHKVDWVKPGYIIQAEENGLMDDVDELAFSVFQDPQLQ